MMVPMMMMSIMLHWITLVTHRVAHRHSGISVILSFHLITSMLYSLSSLCPRAKDETCHNRKWVKNGDFGERADKLDGQMLQKICNFTKFLMRKIFERIIKKYYYFYVKFYASEAKLVIRGRRFKSYHQHPHIWRSTQVRLKGTHSKCVRAGNCRVGSNPTFSA